MWAFEPGSYQGGQLMIDHIDKKRKALGLDKATGKGAVRYGMRGPWIGRSKEDGECQR